jgi:hypothetical protein
VRAPRKIARLLIDSPEDLAPLSVQQYAVIMVRICLHGELPEERFWDLSENDVRPQVNWKYVKDLTYTIGWQHL